jgi:hypothetical protein
MPDEILDVAGQPGGPSPDIQALVDQEQADLIARIKAERDPLEAASRAELMSRIEKAKADRIELIELVRSLDARLKIVEAKLDHA